MIEFQNIKLGNKEEIDSCLLRHSERSYIFNFTSLLAWKSYYKFQFSVKNQTLFLQIQEKDQNYYLMPQSQIQDLRKSFCEILDDSERKKIPFQMIIPFEYFELVEKEFPGKFEFIQRRDMYEYIYSSEQLNKLRGNKLQNKRNHINRFKSDNPNWEYISLGDQKDIDECKAMYEEWYKFHE
jgi:hypothetical protein